MNCPECGAELPDDSVYCSVCGVRVDGKTECVKCGRLIGNKNVYCNYCGARQDGKIVCPQCGTPMDGNSLYCPKCGAKMQKSGKDNSDPLFESSPRAGEVQKRTFVSGRGGVVSVDNVLSIVQTSLIFAAIACLALFAFFIGISGTIDGYVVGADTVALKSNDSALYYIIYQWKDIADLLETYRDAGSGVYFEGVFVLYAPSVLCAVAMLTNIVVCLVYFGLGLYAFVKSFTGKKIRLYKYFLPPAVTTLLAVIIVKSCSSVEGLSSVNLVETSINGATVAEIVIVSVLITGAFVLELVRHGVFYKPYIYKLVCMSVAALMTAIAAGVFTNTFIRFRSTEYGLFEIMALYLFVVGFMKVDTVSSNDLTVSALLVAEFFVFAVIAVVAVLAIYFMLASLNRRKTGMNVIGLVTGNTVGYVAYLVINVVIAKLFEDNTIVNTAGNSHIGGTTIVGLVLSVFALAACIVNICIGSAAERKNSVVHEKLVFESEKQDGGDGNSALQPKDEKNIVAQSEKTESAEDSTEKIPSE